MSRPSSLSWEQVRGEWSANRRLRIGVLVVVAILWIYLILLMRDRISVEATTWQSVESQIARVRAAASSADWPTRSQDVKNSLNDLEKLLWREGSIGQAQAAFQESITRTLSVGGMTPRGLRISLSESTSTDTPDLVPMRARLQIEFRPASFYPWLGLLYRERSEGKPSFVIESLLIRGGQSPFADLELVGYALRSSSTSNVGAATK